MPFPRRDPLPDWPAVQDSMGTKICTNTKLGSSTAWFPRGPALDQYTNYIRPRIDTILSGIELPENERLFVKLYIIGKSEMKARPIIMICCRIKDICKEAAGLIRTSGLLDQEGNRGFGTGSIPIPLEFSSVPTSTGATAAPGTSSPTVQNTRKVDIYGLSKRGMGRKLGFVQHGSNMRFATGGPIIRLGDDLYQLTVAHAMSETPVPAVSSTHDWDFNECEFDGQSDMEDDNHAILSTGSLSPEGSTTNADIEMDEEQSIDSSTSSASFVRNPYSPEHSPEHETREDSGNKLLKDSELQRSQEAGERDSTSVFLGSIIVPERGYKDLDYFLVKMPEEEETEEANTVHYGDTKIEVDDIAKCTGEEIGVLIVTARGLFPGVIVPDSTSMMTSGSSSLDTLLTALLSRSIQNGDSGSAVIHAATGQLYGHVVLGVPGDLAAYILPSQNIFIDILSKFGQLPRFQKVVSDGEAVTTERSEYSNSRADGMSMTSLYGTSIATSLETSSQPHDSSTPSYGIPQVYSLDSNRMLINDHNVASAATNALGKSLQSDDPLLLYMGQCTELTDNNAGFKERQMKQSEREPLLACPFQKRYPKLNLECPRGFERISHMKIHLVRRHPQRPYCLRCKRVFDTEEDRNEHTSATFSTMLCQAKDSAPPEGIDLRIREALSRGSPHKSAQTQWFEIWDLLFPGVSRPSSSTIHDFEQDVEGLALFLEARGQAIIQSTLRSMNTGSAKPDPAHFDSFARAVMSQTVQDLWETWQSHRRQSSRATTSSGSRGHLATGSSRPEVYNSHSTPSGISSNRGEPPGLPITKHFTREEWMPEGSARDTPRFNVIRRDIPQDDLVRTFFSRS